MSCEVNFNTVRNGIQDKAAEMLSSSGLFETIKRGLVKAKDLLSDFQNEIMKTNIAFKEELVQPSDKEGEYNINPSDDLVNKYLNSPKKSYSLNNSSPKQQLEDFTKDSLTYGRSISSEKDLAEWKSILERKYPALIISFVPLSDYTYRASAKINPSYKINEDGSFERDLSYFNDDNALFEQEQRELRNLSFKEDVQLINLLKKYPKLLEQKRSVEQAQDSINLIEEINTTYPDLHASIIVENDGHYIHVQTKSLLPKEILNDEVNKNFTPKMEGEILMNKLLFKMKKLFPSFNYQFIDQAEVERLNPDLTKEQILGTRGFIIGNNVYLVSGKYTPEVIVEEFLHPFVEFLSIDNPLLLENLFQEGIDIYGDLLSVYDSYNKSFGETTAKKEVVTRALSYLITDLEKSKETSSPELKKSLLDLFISWLKSLFSITGVKPSSTKYPTSLTLKELAEKISDSEHSLNYITTHAQNYSMSSNDIIETRWNQIGQILSTSGITKLGDKEGYVDKNGKPVKRITDIVKEINKKIFGQTEDDFTAEQRAEFDIMAERGTNFHKDVENMFRRYVDSSTGLKRNIDEVDISNFKPELLIDPSKKNSYIKNLNSLVLDVLNSYSDQTRFRFETIVYNAKKNVAGTVDFIAVTDNGRVDILDWKSIYSLKDNKIPAYKKRGFSVQLKEYVGAIKDQLILTDEDFGKVRVIPILPKLKEGTGIVEEIKIGVMKPKEGIDSSLLPVLTDIDELFTKNVKTLLKAFNDIIQTENKRLSKESGYERKDYKLQNELDDAVRNLLVSEDPEDLYNFIRNVGNRTKEYLKVVKEFIDSNENITREQELEMSDRLKEAVHSLRALRGFINFAESDMDEILKHPEQKRIYVGVKESIDVLNKNLDKGIDQFIKKFGDKYGIKRIDAPETKIGFLKFWTRQLSVAATKSTLLLEKMLRPTLNNIAKDKQAIQSKTLSFKHSLMEWGEKNNKTLKEVYDIFLDKYDNPNNPLNGKNNGLLKAKIDKNFYLKRNAMEDASPKERVKFYRENYDIEGYKAAYKLEYDRRVAEIMAKIYSTNESINKKKQKEAVQKFVNNFSYNNPETSFNKSNWLLNKFLKEELHYSEFYKTLLQEDNKPLFEFYNYMQDVISRAQGTGIDTEVGITKRFIPRLMKGIVETGTNSKAQIERLVRELQINPDDYNYGNINPATGKEENKMFLYYTQKIEKAINYKSIDENGNEVDRTTYDFSELSTDLLVNFEEFEKNVSYIENMQGLESFAEVLSEFEASKRVIDTNRFGKALDVQPISQGYGGENYKYFDRFRKYYIYNQKLQNVKDKSLTLPFKYKGEEISVSGVKLVSNIAALARMTAFSIPNIASPMRNMFIGKVNTMFDNSKHFTSSLDIKNGMHFLDDTLFKSLPKLLESEKEQKFVSALNFFLPDLNLMEQRFKDKLSMNSGWQILTPENLQILMRNSEKVVAIGVFRALMENTTVRDGKLVNINELVEREIKEKYGYESKYSLPENFKVNLKEINDEISNRVKELKRDDNLYEYIELQESGNDKKFTIKGVDLKDPSLEEVTNIARNYSQRATGMSSEMDISLAQTSFLAKMLFMYRSWIPRTVQARFGELSYNNLTDSYDEGRMINYISYLTKHGENRLSFFKRLIYSMAGNIDKEKAIEIAKQLRKEKYNQLIALGHDIRELTEEEYIDMYLRNIQNSYKELRTLIGLFTIINTGLIAAGEGDGDKEKNLSRLAQRELTKYYKELTFYYDPMSAYEIIKNPFPILSYTGNLLLFGKNLVAEPFNPEGNKPTKYFFRSIPITKEIISYTPLFDPSLAEELGVRINPNYALIR